MHSIMGRLWLLCTAAELKGGGRGLKHSTPGPHRKVCQPPPTPTLLDTARPREREEFLRSHGGVSGRPSLLHCHGWNLGVPRRASCGKPHSVPSAGCVYPGKRSIHSDFSHALSCSVLTHPYFMCSSMPAGLSLAHVSTMRRGLALVHTGALCPGFILVHVDAMCPELTLVYVGTMCRTFTLVHVDTMCVGLILVDAGAVCPGLTIVHVGNMCTELTLTDVGAMSGAHPVSCWHHVYRAHFGSHWCHVHMTFPSSCSQVERAPPG